LMAVALFPAATRNFETQTNASSTVPPNRKRC
jgi:hypothetical protein